MRELLFRIEDNDAMQRAIARARALHPKARIVDGERRIYEVESKNRRAFVYEVRFYVTPDGKRLATCHEKASGRPCKGLNDRSVCYHVPTAAAVNIAAQFLRRYYSAAAERAAA